MKDGYCDKEDELEFEYEYEYEYDYSCAFLCNRYSISNRFCK